MKESVIQLIMQSTETLRKNELFANFEPDRVRVERTRDSRHGDFSTNIALKLSTTLGCSARQLAQKLVDALPESSLVKKAEVAGPGFINFYLAPEAYWALIDEIRQASHNYGKSDSGNGCRVMVEFVSTNPTGPLHVGHGRGAAYGDALTRVLTAAGYETHSEYYVNDAGRQMDILAVSVWLRYLQTLQEIIHFPGNAYQGDYIRDIAKRLLKDYGDKFHVPSAGLLDSLSEDAEESVDQIISRCKSHLLEDYQIVFDAACSAMVNDIREDLIDFGVTFDHWFYESCLVEKGDIQQSIQRLEEHGYLYEKAGAKWFRSTDFGDEKDRVVVRENGAYTYFASDIAYHFNKAERGFDRIVNIFGADHHGYTQRLKASFEALGNNPERLEFILVQFAYLLRANQRVSMSTRGGDFVTLRELRDEVGNDAARFFYVLRKSDQHMDFDLDLAKSQSAENPVYYIQYAHARICSVFEQASDKGLHKPPPEKPDYCLLVEHQELEILKMLSKFPEVVSLAADSRAPHQIAYYLRELAHMFHSYYNAHPFLSSKEDIRLARLSLIDAIRIVLENGLTMLGVSAPASM